MLGQVSAVLEPGVDPEGLALTTEGVGGAVDRIVDLLGDGLGHRWRVTSTSGLRGRVRGYVTTISYPSVTMIKPPPAKRLPTEERRVLIVEAAGRLFGERGYEATRLDDVAAAAGVTKPILYRHFDSTD